MDGELLTSFSDLNGNVRGVLAVSKTSGFARHEVDGFCLIGTKLWVISHHAYFYIGEGIPLQQSLYQVAAVNETRIVFKSSAGWHTWTFGDKQATRLYELAGVSRAITLPGGSFALIRPTMVDFVDENLSAIASYPAKVNPHYHIVGIRRGRRRAIVILEQQGLRLIDEQMGYESMDWLNLRAKGARFDGQTALSDDLRVALTSAGARNEALISLAPSLGKIMTPTSYSPFAVQKVQKLNFRGA